MTLINPEILRQLRTRHQLTREQLRERSGVSERHIARIEASETLLTVRPSTAERLARAFRVEEDDLASDELLGIDNRQRSQARQQARTSARARGQRSSKATHVEFNQLKLVALRMWSGLSRRELARETGISERQIARIETSKPFAVVRRDTVERLAEVLNVDFDSFIDNALLSELPSDALRAGRAGLKKALPRVQLSARVSHHVRLAYDLVQRRYGPSARELMVLAPLMFVLLAEGSLAWRRERHASVLEALDRLQNHGATEPHLYFTMYVSDVEDGLDAEDESISSRDVRGDKIRGDTYLKPPGYEDVHPFSDYLKKLVEDTGIGELVDFESGDRIVPDRYWGTEPPRLFPDWLEEICGGSDHARWALEYGDVRVSAIPGELMADSAKEARVAWLESKLSDETKELMDRSTSLHEKLYGLDALSDGSVGQARGELIGFYSELLSAGRDRSTANSS